jgi:hypothetical protein
MDTHWLAEEMWVDHGKDGETSNYEDGRNHKMFLMLQYLKVELYRRKDGDNTIILTVP